MVAASDYAGEFWSRRDQLVEKLITALLPQCFGCRDATDGEEGDNSVKRDGVLKQSNDNDDNDGPKEIFWMPSEPPFPRCLWRCTYLSDLLKFPLKFPYQCEVQVPYLLYGNATQEVNDIWLYNSPDCEAVANLFLSLIICWFESLRRQLMELSVVLMATSIGKGS